MKLSWQTAAHINGLTKPHHFLLSGCWCSLDLVFFQIMADLQLGLLWYNVFCHLWYKISGFCPVRFLIKSCPIQIHTTYDPRSLSRQASLQFNCSFVLMALSCICDLLDWNLCCNHQDERIWLPCVGEHAAPCPYAQAALLCACSSVSMVLSCICNLLDLKLD